MMDVQLYRIPVNAPQDVSGLVTLLDDGVIRAEEIAAILAQNEGDGHARGFTLHVLEEVIASRTGETPDEVARRVPMLMIGLAGMGIMVPHLNVFVRREVAPRPGLGKRLTLGTAVTRVLQPEEYGTMAMLREVARATREALAQIGAPRRPDVPLIYVKVPELTPARIRDAEARGAPLRTRHYRQAAAFNRGAAALGAAVALGEFAESQFEDTMLGTRLDIWTRHVSVSSGTENAFCKIVVFANTEQSVSTLVAGNGVMRDAIDLDGVREAFRAVGIPVADHCCPTPEQMERVAAIFVKANGDAVDEVRGYRNAMLSDYLWSFSGMQTKAIAHAVVAALIGDPLVMSASGSEHQGPPGGNVVTVFARPS